jgi:F-type H+-transporting ATPase subunit c
MTGEVEWVKVAAYVSAGICMGIGAFGPALGQGFIGGKACESIGKRPENANVVMRTMIVALAFVESTAIYALLVSLILMFYVGK